MGSFGRTLSLPCTSSMRMQARMADVTQSKSRMSPGKQPTVHAHHWICMCMCNLCRPVLEDMADHPEGYALSNEQAVFMACSTQVSHSPSHSAELLGRPWLEQRS